VVRLCKMGGEHRFPEFFTEGEQNKGITASLLLYEPNPIFDKYFSLGILTRKKKRMMNSIVCGKKTSDCKILKEHQVIHISGVNSGQMPSKRE